MINIRDINFLEAFGKELRRLRHTKNLSQEALADLADLSTSQIGRIERGKINPSICTLKIIAEALGVKMSVMFENL